MKISCVVKRPRQMFSKSSYFDSPSPIWIAKTAYREKSNFRNASRIWWKVVCLIFRFKCPQKHVIFTPHGLNWQLILPIVRNQTFITFVRCGENLWRKTFDSNILKNTSLDSLRPNRSLRSLITKNQTFVLFLEIGEKLCR